MFVFVHIYTDLLQGQHVWQDISNSAQSMSGRISCLRSAAHRPFRSPSPRFLKTKSRWFQSEKFKEKIFKWRHIWPHVTISRKLNTSIQLCVYRAALQWNNIFKPYSANMTFQYMGGRNLWDKITTVFLSWANSLSTSVQNHE